MKPNQFEIVLGQIVCDWILLDDRAALFESLGFSPGRWPECEAKKVWIEFSGYKSRAAAKLNLSSKLQNFSYCELPHDPSQLQVVHNECVSYGRAIEISDALRRNPLRLKEILNSERLSVSGGDTMFLLADAIGPWITEREKAIEEGRDLVTIKAFPKISNMIGGFNPGRVSLIVAGTGIGKTMLAQALSSSARETMGVIYFNMEMSKPDIVGRFLAAEIKTPIRTIRTDNGQTLQRIADFHTSLTKTKQVWISSGRSLELDHMMGIVANKKSQDKSIGFVVVDYDQKIRSRSHGEEWQVILRAVEELEEMAKREDVHVLILAQGDESGDPKASRRAKQPASCVLHLFEEDGNYFIETIKNRFGAMKQKLAMGFVGDQSLIFEKDMVIETRKMKPIGGSNGTSYRKVYNPADA